MQVFEGACPRGTVRADELISALVMYAPEGGEKSAWRSARLVKGESQQPLLPSLSAVSRERAAELVSQLEPDSNGLIDYAMFVDMMMQS